MSKDLLLGTDTHDLIVGNYDLSFADNEKAVAQNIKQRLLHFFEEWFLNLGAGTMWIERVFVKSMPAPIVESIIKARIVQTPGVNALLSFSMDSSPSSERQSNVSFVVQTSANETASATVEI